MSQWFEVGKKVICIADNWVNEGSGIVTTAFPNSPVKGQIYTVRDIVTCPQYHIPCLRFVELVNPVVTFTLSNNLTDEGYFDAIAFKPLEEKKNETNIDVFLKLLNTKSITELVE